MSPRIAYPSLKIFIERIIYISAALRHARRQYCNSGQTGIALLLPKTVALGRGGWRSRRDPCRADAFCHLLAGVMDPSSARRCPRSFRRSIFTMTLPPSLKGEMAVGERTVESGGAPALSDVRPLRAGVGGRLIRPVPKRAGQNRHGWGYYPFKWPAAIQVTERIVRAGKSNGLCALRET